MNRCLSFITIFFVFVFLVYPDTRLMAEGQSSDSRYQQAYAEISDMLDGKQPLSIKRAVYLAEWAYLDGELDYEEDFCKEITRVAAYIRQVIALNHFEHYKTARQFMLCDYFFRPCNGNGQVPYSYEHDGEYPDGDWHYQLASRTLKSHKGQCRSLPWTFKLIAEELGAEACIAHAPRHCFIMYRDEDDHYPEDWVNVELTSHQYVPTFALKEMCGISESAIVAGTYLTPLTDIQTVACQLSELALGFLFKYGNHYDDFTRACAEKSLQYYPMNPNAIIILGNSLDALGLPNRHCVDMLRSTYWTQETEELRDKWNHGKDPKDVQIITKEMYEQIPETTKN